MFRLVIPNKTMPTFGCTPNEHWVLYVELNNERYNKWNADTYFLLKAKGQFKIE